MHKIAVVNYGRTILSDRPELDEGAGGEPVSAVLHSSAAYVDTKNVLKHAERRQFELKRRWLVKRHARGSTSFCDTRLVDLCYDQLLASLHTATNLGDFPEFLAIKIIDRLIEVYSVDVQRPQEPHLRSRTDLDHRLLAPLLATYGKRRVRLKIAHEDLTRWDTRAWLPPEGFHVSALLQRAPEDVTPPALMRLQCLSAHITSLGLSNCGLNDTHMHIISHLQHLRYLDLSHNRISSDGLQALTKPLQYDQRARGACLKKLKGLDISHTDIVNPWPVWQPTLFPRLDAMVVSYPPHRHTPLSIRHDWALQTAHLLPAYIWLPERPRSIPPIITRPPRHSADNIKSALEHATSLCVCGLDSAPLPPPTISIANLPDGVPDESSDGSRVPAAVVRYERVDAKVAENLIRKNDPVPMVVEETAPPETKPLPPFTRQPRKKSRTGIVDARTFQPIRPPMASNQITVPELQTSNQNTGSNRTGHVESMQSSAGGKQEIDCKGEGFGELAGSDFLADVTNTHQPPPVHRRCLKATQAKPTPSNSESTPYVNPFLKYKVKMPPNFKPGPFK